MMLGLQSFHLQSQKIVDGMTLTNNSRIKCNMEPINNVHFLIMVVLILQKHSQNIVYQKINKVVVLTKIKFQDA